MPYLIGSSIGIESSEWLGPSSVQRAREEGHESRVLLKLLSILVLSVSTSRDYTQVIFMLHVDSLGDCQFLLKPCFFLRVERTSLARFRTVSCD